jgi:hypothetical protein
MMLGNLSQEFAVLRGWEFDKASLSFAKLAEKLFEIESWMRCPGRTMIIVAQNAVGGNTARRAGLRHAMALPAGLDPRKQDIGGEAAFGCRMTFRAGDRRVSFVMEFPVVKPAIGEHGPMGPQVVLARVTELGIGAEHLPTTLARHDVMALSAEPLGFESKDGVIRFRQATIDFVGSHRAFHRWTGKPGNHWHGSVQVLRAGENGEPIS